MSYDGKLNYQSIDRRRDRPAYPLTPVKQPRITGDGGPVHMLTPKLFKLCRKKGAGLQLGTNAVRHVTCPACLKKLESSHV